MVEVGAYRNLAHCLATIARKEGARGLYKVCFATAAARGRQPSAPRECWADAGWLWLLTPPLLLPPLPPVVHFRLSAQGAWPSILKAAPAAAITFTVYEMASAWLDARARPDSEAADDASA